MNAKSKSKATGTVVSATLVGAAGTLLDDAETTADAQSVGISGGDGYDCIANMGAITTESTSEASGTGVSVTLVGAAFADSSTTATSRATGIASGNSRDKVYNNGTISASTDATAKGVSVAAGLVGYFEADASTTANAIATGIDVGGGDDAVFNGTAIDVNANSIADSISGSVSFAGVAEAKASSTANATATGIAGGDGDDYVNSHGSIDVAARAKAVVNSVNVGVIGAALSKVRTTAESHATAVTGDSGDDVMVTASTINATASSNIVISSTGVSVAGAGGFDATLTAGARATGIDGGAGREKIHNEAVITAVATSTLSSSGDSTVVFGASSADAESGAFTDAIGIDGGADNDHIWNLGTINAGATATLTLSNSSFNFGGAGGANGRLSASTHSAGVVGGAGKDVIHNEGNITVNANSALSSSSGSDVVFGASAAGASSGAFTDAVGIDGGDQGGYIWNKGKVVSGSTANVTLSSSSFNFGGAGGAKGKMSASTHSVGIAGGGGRDGIKNEGAIDVDATSTLSSSGDSDVVFGASSSGATSGAFTDAIGIDAGDDDDCLWNLARIDVDSVATLAMDNTSFNFGGAGGTEGTLSAATRSVGLYGGSGNDWIKNEGEVFVNTRSTLSSTGGSDVAFGASGATATSGAFTEAIGIDGGTGVDHLWNKAKIYSWSRANLTLRGSSYTFGGTGDVSGKLTAGTESVAIRGGSGDDMIRNEGKLIVDAKSDLKSKGRVNTTFGTSASDALATTDTHATGIDGGDGDDVIDNFTKITVTSTAKVTSANSAYVFGGTSSTGAVVKAFSSSVGMSGGKGNDRLYNEGEINVNTSSSATSSGSAYAEFGGAKTAGLVITDAIAVGIDGSDGDDVVINKGQITVKGDVSADSTHNTDTGFLFGGGDSVARAGASLMGYGVDVGEGDNDVLNEGSIAVDLFGFVSTETDSDGADVFDGDAFSRSDSTLSATAVGIWAGNGDNHIMNKGTIDIKTWRRFTIIDIPFDLPTGTLSDAYADGDGIDGDGTAKSYATTSVWAAGIATGNGNNEITNDGTITVDARASATALADADSDAGGSTSTPRDAKITARSYGIRTGSGNDCVTNEGTIDVTTTANNNTGSGDITATADGTETGSGNDEIFNYGTINSKRIINGVQVRGTAINAGAGEDTVLMGDASAADGNIKLGANDDTLHLLGTPVVTGFVRGGGGTDSLIFDGAGSFARPLQGFEVATKKSKGTYSVPTLATMQHLEVDKGTLQINSDYQMSGASTFQARVKGDGTNGQLQVGGTATVDGSLVVVRDRGHYLDGTTYDVLTANQVEGAFVSESLPDPTPLLSFSVEQQPAAVQVQANVNSFKSVAGQGNEVGGAVAQCLDKILPTATGDVSEMLGSLQSLPSESDIESAVASLSPTSYDSFTKSVLATVESYVGATHDRMAAVRAKIGPRDLEGRAMFLPGDQPISFAHTTTGLLQPDTSLGAWSVNFNDNGGRTGLGSGYQGFDYDTYGVDMGFDHPLGERSIMGTSFASTFTDVDFDSGLGRGEIDSYLTSIYGTHFLNDRTYVESVLSFGHSESDNIRRVGAGSMQRTAYSTHDGDVVSAFVETGRAFAAGAWRSEVFGSLHYASLDEEAFEETGAGGINLIVEDRRTESLVSELGLRVGRPIETNLGLLMPQLSIAWAHDFNVDDRKITARFADSPSTAFTVKGSDIESDVVRLGGFLTLTGSNELAVSAGFNAELRENSSDVSGLVRLQFSF